MALECYWFQCLFWGEGFIEILEDLYDHNNQNIKTSYFMMLEMKLKMFAIEFEMYVGV